MQSILSFGRILAQICPCSQMHILLVPRSDCRGKRTQGHMPARLWACLLSPHTLLRFQLSLGQAGISCIRHIGSDWFFAQMQISQGEGAHRGQNWPIGNVGWWDRPANAGKLRHWKYPEEEKGWPGGLSNRVPFLLRVWRRTVRQRHSCSSWKRD